MPRRGVGVPTTSAQGAVAGGRSPGLADVATQLCGVPGVPSLLLRVCVSSRSSGHDLLMTDQQDGFETQRMQASHQAMCCGCAVQVGEHITLGSDDEDTNSEIDSGGSVAWTESCHNHICRAVKVRWGEEAAWRQLRGNRSGVRAKDAVHEHLPYASPHVTSFCRNICHGTCPMAASTSLCVASSHLRAMVVDGPSPHAFAGVHRLPAPRVPPNCCQPGHSGCSWARYMASPLPQHGGSHNEPTK